MVQQGFITLFLFSRNQRAIRKACKELKVRLATTEAERKPNTPPLGAELTKGLNYSFKEAKSCLVVLQRDI